MKNIVSNLSTLLCVVLLLSMAISCKKLAGLDLQQNVDHPTHTLDPRTNMNAWQFIKSRAFGNPDSIFYQMYLGIMYSGIDTNEYIKPGRTYIVLYNTAIFKPQTSATDTVQDAYCRKYKVNGKFGTQWSDYSPAQVKSWLQYLILQKNYNYNFGSSINAPDLVVLNAFADSANTLLPPGTDPNNPGSIMMIGLSNDRNSSVLLNSFLNSVYPTTIRTAGFILTNGSAHVSDKLVYYGITQ
jgi:hypothetical protein